MSCPLTFHLPCSELLLLAATRHLATLPTLSDCQSPDVFGALLTAGRHTCAGRSESCLCCGYLSPHIESLGRAGVSEYSGIRIMVCFGLGSLGSPTDINGISSSVAHPFAEDAVRKHVTAIHIARRLAKGLLDWFQSQQQQQQSAKTTTAAAEPALEFLFFDPTYTAADAKLLPAWVSAALCGKDGVAAAVRPRVLSAAWEAQAGFCEVDHHTFVRRTVVETNWPRAMLWADPGLDEPRGWTDDVDEGVVPADLVAAGVAPSIVPGTPLYVISRPFHLSRGRSSS